MQHATARRAFKRHGQAARRVAVDAGAAGASRRSADWQQALLAAADSDDAAKRLWAAVLNDAIAALVGQHPESRPRGATSWRPIAPAELWTEAVAWVLAREPEPLGTFESVCGVLDLDVDAVRRDLARLAAAHATIVTRRDPAPLKAATALDAVDAVGIVGAGGGV